MVSLRYKTYLLLACLLGIAFIVFTYLVQKGLFLSTDSFFDQMLPLKLSSPLYFISRGLAYLYVLLVAVIAGLVLRFIRCRQNDEALMLLTIFSGVILAEFILKPMFGIPCPQNYYSNVLANKEVFGLLHILQKVGLSETCYPSSHVTSYSVFCGYLAYLALKYIKNKKSRSMLFITMLIIIVLIGPSRLYLHVHWFSDVIAGYLLGLSLLLLIISFHQYFELKTSNRR